MRRGPDLRGGEGSEIRERERGRLEWRFGGGGWVADAGGVGFGRGVKRMRVKGTEKVCAEVDRKSGREVEMKRLEEEVLELGADGGSWECVS